MEEPEAKRLRGGKDDEEEEPKRKGEGASCSNPNPDSGPGQVKNNSSISVPRRIESGTFSKIPPELFPHILKFLSSEVLFIICSLKFLWFFFSKVSILISCLLYIHMNLQDLVSCSLVCSFLNYAAADESLWRRL